MKKQIVDYVIVSNAEPSHLTNLVGDLIIRGYEPLGGIAVATYLEAAGTKEEQEVPLFCQALIKYGRRAPAPLSIQNPGSQKSL